MGEKLENPPLLEALCEFRFAPSGDWDWTIPGRLFDQVGDEFSERGQVSVATVGNVTTPEGQLAGQTLERSDRVQLRRPDGTAMVQTGKHLLAINHLRPYPQWESFLELILNVFAKHQSIAGDQPLARVGLRYINLLKEMADFTALENEITVIPTFASFLAKPLIGFYQRYELVHENPPGVLIHQTGVQTRSGKPCLILDLDFGSDDVRDLKSVDLVSKWLDAAHDRIHESFVASLTEPKYRGLRGGSK